MADLVHRVFNAAGIPKRLKALTMVMAAYAEKYGVDNVYPSVGTLAEGLGVAHSTIQQGLHELRANNVLTVLEPGGGRRRSTKYRFNVQALPGDHVTWTVSCSQATLRRRVRVFESCYQGRSCSRRRSYAATWQFGLKAASDSMRCSARRW
jgi:hypothetical protein